MNCLRRATLRAALSASRTAAPKAPVAPFAAAIARSIPVAQPIAARYFSQTFRVQNEEASYDAVAETQEQARPNDAQARTLFVRNLIFDATEEHLKALFEKYGKVDQANIVRDPRGLSRGFGFVTMSTAEEMDAACAALHGSFWHGRRLTAAPKTFAEKEGKSTPTSPTKQLYIGNIPYETTDAELNAIFKGLHGLRDIRIAVDRTTGWPRGFAHADFASVEEAQKAYEKLSGVRLGARTLNIDYAHEHTRVRGGQQGQK